MPLIASQVKPGPAHAPSTKFPEDVLPLHTVVGTQGRLVLQLSDCMGNKCIEGGAHLEVSVNTNGAPKAALTCKCDDQQDGTFLVTWSSEVSHKYMLELKIHGVHIMGSPAPLTLLPGDLEVSRCSLLAPREAVAGVASLIETKCCDAYGNEVAPDVLAGHAPPFGLLLVPALLKGASGPTGKDGRDVEEKRGPNKGDHVDEKRRAALLKKEERANLVKTLDTMSFHGSWDGCRMKMSFVPKEAGDFELHVWCEPNALGVRQFLPGCPTMVHVKPGRASAIGSHVRSDGVSVALLTAGDKLALKVQICDEFNNFVSLASASDMTSMLETPIGQLALIQKTSEKLEDHKEGDKKKHSVAAGSSAVGLYEIVSPGELTVKGVHRVSIQLYGDSITGAPLTIMVAPGPPVYHKSYLEAKGSRQEIESPIDVILHLLDKYGNRCEQGGVRVDAKAYGSKASEAKVVDNANGTFSISFIAAVPGDYKVQCRLENADLQVLQLHVLEKGEKAVKVDLDEEMAPAFRALASSKPPVPPKSARSASSPTSSMVTAPSGLPPAPLMPLRPPDGMSSQVMSGPEATLAKQDADAAKKKGKKKGSKTGREEKSAREEKGAPSASSAVTSATEGESTKKAAGSGKGIKAGRESPASSPPTPKKEAAKKGGSKTVRVVG